MHSQSVLALHRIRQNRRDMRTALANQLRGLLGEFGVVLKAGRRAAVAEMPTRWPELEAKLPGVLIEALRGPARIAALDVPGLDAFRLANQLARFDPSPATEQRLLAQPRIVEEVLADAVPARRIVTSICHRASPGCWAPTY